MAALAGSLTDHRRWTAALGACAVLAWAVLLASCDDKASADVAPVKIAGKTFFLELAATDAVRYKGLGGRTHIDDDGGMLFVVPRPAVQSYVMRDCPIGIDILYLDGSGRILSMHEMKPEPPRGPGETDEAYNARLKPYSSRFPAQFVVELQEGMIGKLGVKEGEQVGLDAPGLKARAR